MDVKTFVVPSELHNVSGDLLAIDLEMANSFRTGPSVICMIGIEFYEPGKKRTCASIGYITRRSEEKELVAWLLDQLARFRRRHREGRLLSFSGLDNDVRWLKERLERHDLADPEDSILDEMGHVDLKVEFRRRTQSDNISLKRLEEICGIERGSSVTSKKVSYILTDLVKKDKLDTTIPDRLHEYLRDDVHNLFLIFDRWQNLRLEPHNLPDEEVHTLLASIIRTADKFVRTNQNRNGYRKEFAALKTYHAALRERMSRVLAEESFENFSLPDFPPVRIKLPDFERLRKKHNYLGSIQMVDDQTGAYRLRRVFFRPRGALAVVRRGGRLLMIRRAESLKRAAGLWGLPGGEQEKGETPEQCAQRELWEELRLEGKVAGVLGKSASYNGEYELIWVELAVEDVSTLDPYPEEVGEVRWVTPEELALLEPLIPRAREGFAEFLGAEWGAGPPERTPADTNDPPPP